MALTKKSYHTIIFFPNLKIFFNSSTAFMNKFANREFFFFISKVMMIFEYLERHF